MCAVRTRSFSRVVKVSLECEYLLRSTSLCCNRGMRWKKKRVRHFLLQPGEGRGTCTTSCGLRRLLVFNDDFSWSLPGVWAGVISPSMPRYQQGRVCSASCGDGAYSSTGMSRSETESWMENQGMNGCCGGGRGAAGSSGKPGAGKGEKSIHLCACACM